MRAYAKLQEEQTRLIRNGDTVHLWGCRRAGKKWVSWKWAEEHSDAEALSVPWLRTCRYCFPERGGS